MKINTYESIVLINATLDDEQINQIIDRIKEFIVTNGGEIKDVENWGRKRLAYTVNKSKIGYYAIFRFTAPSNIVSKLERTYLLDEYVLRHLTIKLSPEAIEYLDKKKLQTQVDTDLSDLQEESPENLEIIDLTKEDE
ncbi:MAG: 30S ribosomal protein S6 [Ignavibacteriaceae bacterium]|nr:30S ribosomal protein S6 [Ignavibacteriaceae bacterium]